MKNIALIGTPNSGKSSLFNRLTRLNQKVANYPGVTVEKTVGRFNGISITDLPGLKSLWVDGEDEKISRDQILEFSDTGQPLLFIANGNHLQNSLLLFSEIADLQIPMAIIVNFKDELEKNQIQLNLDELQSRLGCKVVLANSKKGEGIEEVKEVIEKDQFTIPHSFCRSNYESTSNAGFNNYYRTIITNANNINNEELQKEFEMDINKRQLIIGDIINNVISGNTKENQLIERTAKWDKIVLHPIYGSIIFLLTMFTVFQAIFALAEFPMNWIDGIFSFLSSTAYEVIPWKGLADLVANGIIPGLAGVLIFIPQIAILFLFLGILESTGYLSRISYIADNFLRKFGLSGSSVIPLLSGAACAIPAIMSARTIKSSRERLAVILVTPFMTCTARLPVYTILIALIFPYESDYFFNVRGLVLFGMYMLGTITSLVVAKIIYVFSRREENKFWILDLPIYRSPNWRNVWLGTYQKTRSFVVDAGKIIFIISIILWFTASFSPYSNEKLDQRFESYKIENPNSQMDKPAFELENSYAGILGKSIEPVIKPLGYDWKIGIALITSFAAREVFVGTLSTIYSIGSEEEESILERLRQEKDRETGENRFNLGTAVSLLLFYAFAMQCMSTMAIVRRETNSWTYPIFQFLVMLIMAYLAALAANTIL